MNSVHKRIIEEGDLVILYERKDSLTAVYMTKGEKFSCVFGAFPHDSFIGKEYGSIITSQTGNKYLYALEPTAELWSSTMKTRTQIIFKMDASVIVFNLFLKPGCRVVESGTGSGALSTAISRVIYPTGHLFTFEYNEMRADEARAEFEKNRLSDIISVFHRDVYADGFTVRNETSDFLCVDADHLVDAVFLDLPKPYNAIHHARSILKKSGRICCFSPCIEQVQSNCNMLREQGFELIETMEVLLKEYELNSIDNNNSYTTRDRNQKLKETERSQVKREIPTDDDVMEKVEDQKNSLFIPSQNLRESLSSMVLAKGEHIGRGHTAYLTFGTKIK